MTEDEAKVTHCCGPDGTGSGHKISLNPVTGLYDPVPGPRYCIGSACMAWRRTLLSQKERSAFVGSQLQLGMSSNDAYSMLNHMEEDNPSGYCGLAGRPTA